MSNVDKLTKTQKKAFDEMVAGHNVFLTGEAGTGKSFVTTAFIEYCRKNNKKVLITAPTGIAAINVGGSTLHRAFRIPIKPFINDNSIILVPDTVKEADTIIIDEISMCRIDIFEYVATVIRKAEKIKHKPKQLIVIGDFFQLPPVVPKQESEILKTIYPNTNKFYAFESKYWKEFNFENVLLKEIVRQKDPLFIEQLNKARVGDTTCIPFFNNQMANEKFYDGISLVSRNNVASKINEEKLKSLPGKMTVYQAKYIGTFKPTDCLAEEELMLKKGARVMSLINDPMDRYLNGSFGTVEKMTRKAVTVKFDNNITCEISYNVWENVNYTVENTTDDAGNAIKRLNTEVIGTCTQMPLKLAYAITIHKSQGQTFDKVNLYPYAFDVGQLYVALSRVKSLSGLAMCNKMSSKYLMCDEHVKQFYEEIAPDEQPAKPPEQTERQKVVVDFLNYFSRIDQKTYDLLPEEGKHQIDIVRQCFSRNQ